MKRLYLGLLLGAVSLLHGCDQPREAAVPRVAIKPTIERRASAPDDDNLRERCHAGVGALLATLRGNVEIELYASRDGRKAAMFADRVDALLARFRDLSQGKLRYRVIDPKTVDEKQAAKDAGLEEITVADEESIGSGFFGLVFRYGGETNAIPLIVPDTEKGLEFWISNKLREIRDTADDRSTRIGVITEKGEVALTEENLVPPSSKSSGPSIRSVIEQALPYYKLEDVKLDRDIDPDLRAVIITQPGKDYSDEELRRIDTFVMRGRSLAVFASAVNLAAGDATMTAKLDMHRLDRLLAGYGIEMKRASVLDAKLGVRLPVQTGSGSLVHLHVPAILQLRYEEKAARGRQILDSDFAGFFRIGELAFPYASPLVAHPEKQPEAKFATVARSSEQAIVDTDPEQHMKPSENPLPTGQRGQHELAIALKGTLRSAFGTQKSERDARVLVVSSSQFLANPFARAGNPPPLPPQLQMMGPFGGDETLQTIATPYAREHLTSTILAFKNILDWMGDDERLIACSALLLPEKSDAKQKTGKCTKEKLAELMDAGLTLDDALEICRKANK